MNKEEKGRKLARCFICLELPREAIEYIEELQKQIKKKNFFAGKMTEPENLHLTLKFLGEVDEKKLEKVQAKLGEIKMPRFEANLGEIGMFGSRILWIKLNGKQIWDLQEAIDKELADMFLKEERFMSHLTIARMKKVYSKKYFLEYIEGMKIKEIRFLVKEFVLKKSELKPGGPVYSDIERYNLIP